MNKKWIPVIALASVALLAVLLFFLVLKPFVLVETPTEEETLDKVGEEGDLYGILTLYDQIGRKEMQSITVHNQNGTYSFARKNLADPSSSFVLSINGKDFSHIEFDDEKFAELVVATGTTYVQQRLIEEESLAALDEKAREEKYRQYGLDEASDPDYFEIKRFAISETGKGEEEVTVKTYRVYVGNKTVAGTYYLRYNNSAAVYVSHGDAVGKVTESNASYYANLTLQYSPVTNGEYLMKDVTLWNRREEKGTPIGREDAVTVFYALIEGETQTGEEKYESGLIDLRRNREHADLFEGKRVGDGNFYMTVQDGEKEYRYHVKEILAVDTLFLNYSFVNASERDPVFTSVAYSFGAPSSIVGYYANSDSCMDISETMKLFEASEIVEIGVTEEILEKYGLYANTLYLEMPQDGSYSKEEGKENDFVVKNYLSNYLYFSDVQEDGTRYVASMLYDVVGKIDASKVNFLDVDIFHFVNPYLYIVGFANLKSFCLSFGYADFDRMFTFDIEQYTVTNQNKEEQTEYSITYREGGNAEIKYELFAELYTQLLFTQLLGSVEDEGLTAEQVMEEGRLLLSVKAITQSGRLLTYDFYSYGERHVLAVAGGSASFYTLSRHVKKLAIDVQKMIAGESFEHDSFY